jgi:hypothetical protein
LLGGHTKVAAPYANFRHAFTDSENNGYGLSNALIKVNFAYAEYNDAFNVISEIKVLFHSPNLEVNY